MPLQHRVSVRLPSGRYEILIGWKILPRLPGILKRIRLGTDPVVLTNRTLRPTLGACVARLLHTLGPPVKILTVADTERSKSLRTLSKLLAELASWDGPGRRLFLLNVGGGVVGDLGGLAAGMYKRGIPYVQIPTTLLAQVDSAIGGKTGVDLPQGKNLVGLFYQPRLVFIETGFLRSLPERQFRSGLAEVAKCGVIQDAKLFALLERAPLSQIRNHPPLLGALIARAVRAKSKLVEKDERETRQIRTLLNFGHTLGHALEAATDYSNALTHGEAIAVGMIAATRIARELRQISPAAAARIERLMVHLGLPSSFPGASLRRVRQAMAHDKKWSLAPQRWVLPTAIGQARVVEGVPETLVGRVLRTLVKSE